MSIKKFGLILFTAICLFVTDKVYAKDTLSFTAYNVTSACDLEEDGGQVCFEDYLAGDLDSNLITNGVVEADEVIMVVYHYIPAPGSGSVIFQALIHTDSSQLTIYESSYGPEFGKLDKSLGYQYGFYPEYINGRQHIQMWDTYDPTFVDSERIQTLASSGDQGYDVPLSKDTPMFAFFYTVNSDVTPGEDIKIWFSDDPSDTAAADTNADTVELELEELTLSVLSNTSTDGTLKTLTATGNNSLNYPFGFVPSSKYDLEYSFVVPNDVTSITLAGEKNDPNADSA